MERKFLENFGLSKDQISEILNRISGEIGGYKKTLKGMEESERELKAEIERLKSAEFQEEQVGQIMAEKEAIEQEMTTLKRKYAAEKAAKKFEFSSRCAEKAFIKGLMEGENELTDTGEFDGLELYQTGFAEKDPDAFRSSAVTMTIMTGGMGSIISETSAEEFSKMDYMERLTLKEENPERYYELTGK